MAGLNSLALLSEAVKITNLMPGSAGSGSAGRVLANQYYPATGSFLGAADYGTTMFLVSLNDIADALDFEVYESTTSGSTGAQAITGAAKTDVVATDDGKWFSIEVGADQLDLADDFAYLTLKVSGVSGTNIGEIFALQFKPGYQPVTQPAAYYDQVVVV